LPDIAQGLADAIGALASADDQLMELQVAPFMLVNPSPPAIDIFLGDPSQDFAGFEVGELGPANVQTFWTIRARVNTADDEAAQQILYLLAEPAGATSVRYAILYDDGLKEVTDALSVEGPSGFRLYQNAAPSADLEHGGALMGIEWRVLALTKTGPTS